MANTAAILATTPPSVPLTWSNETRGDILVIACQGSFSLNNHQRLDALFHLIESDRAPKIVLDLYQVVHMDSVGIGTVAMIFKHTLASVKKIVLVPNGFVRKALASASLDRVIPLAINAEDALRRLAANGQQP
jgi:anti-anti-sigma factor